MHVRRCEYFSDLAFPLAVRREAAQNDMELHTHDFTELVIITGGKGVHVTEIDSYPIAAGDVFLINANHEHGYSETRQLTLINILFDLDILLPLTSDLRKLSGYHALFALEPLYRRHHRFESHLRLAQRDLAHVLQLASSLKGELNARADGFEFMARALFMQMIGALSRCYSRSHAPLSQPLLRIGEVISHVEQHYTEPLRLEDLAKVAHMSVSSLLRAFKKATQTSPIEHLLRLRIARAADLLRSGELNITEVAYQVGFEDSNYFTRQFKRITGQRPSQVRRRSQAQS